MATTEVPAPAAVISLPRVRVFIDYWNFQIDLNRLEAKEKHINAETARFPINWRALGPWLAKKACASVGMTGYSFDGVIIYCSYNASTMEGRKFRNWATTWLDRQPGVKVECRERRRKRPPKCPSCYREIEYCPLEGCGKKILATEEKGVDTFIATDMIRLAWENAYDLAVLATSDSDLVPAVEFLGVKARKVIQAGFPPRGVHLATACWASFDVAPDHNEIRR